MWVGLEEIRTSPEGSICQAFRIGLGLGPRHSRLHNSLNLIMGCDRSTWASPLVVLQVPTVSHRKLEIAIERPVLGVARVRARLARFWVFHQPTGG